MRDFLPIGLELSGLVKVWTVVQVVTFQAFLLSSFAHFHSHLTTVLHDQLIGQFIQFTALCRNMLAARPMAILASVAVQHGEVSRSK